QRAARLRSRGIWPARAAALRQARRLFAARRRGVRVAAGAATPAGRELLGARAVRGRGRPAARHVRHRGPRVRGQRGGAPARANHVRPPVAGDLAEYTKDIKGSGKLQATIDTSMGTIHCELFGDKAPMRVANFVGLATGKKAWTNPKTGNVEKGKPFFDGLV